MIEEEIDIYRDLQKHLNKMPVGYPETESGVEVRILKHLFTPEQVELALYLKYQPLPLEKVYRKVKKLGINIEELEKKLDEMYHKGLINYGKSGDEKFYANAPLAIGMYEYQLNSLTEVFVKDIYQYFEESFIDEYNKSGIPQLRTIPIGQSLTPKQTVSTYDDLRTIIENIGEPIAVAECICRKAKDLIDEPCKKTNLREICFSFRRAADAYIERGFGKKISKDEALNLLEKAEEDGLVIQPGNSMRPMCICCCCDCCCELLVSQNRLPEPAQFFATNYFAEVDEDLCIGCGTCEERCNMDAVHVEDAIAQVDKKRCIGCGVCVPTCTSEAIKLYKKDNEIIPPKNTAATYVAIMDKKAELARAGKS
ncbi:MAG: 4Fe-4S binding protein [Promethearchaeota archaeon]